MLQVNMGTQDHQVLLDQAPVSSTLVILRLLHQVCENLTFTAYFNNTPSCDLENVVLKIITVSGQGKAISPRGDKGEKVRTIF